MAAELKMLGQVVLNAPKIIEEMQKFYVALRSPKRLRNGELKNVLLRTAKQVEYTLGDFDKWEKALGDGEDAKELTKGMQEILSDLLAQINKGKSLVAKLETMGTFTYLRKRGDVEKELLKFRVEMLNLHGLLSDRILIAVQTAKPKVEKVAAKHEAVVEVFAKRKVAVKEFVKEQAADEKVDHLSKLSHYRAQVEEVEKAEAEFARVGDVAILMGRAVSPSVPKEMLERLDALGRLGRINFHMLDKSKTFETASRRGQIEKARERWRVAFPVAKDDEAKDDKVAKMSDEEFFNARGDLKKQAEAAHAAVRIEIQQIGQTLFNKAMEAEEKLADETREFIRAELGPKSADSEAKRWVTALGDVERRMRNDVSSAQRRVLSLGHELALKSFKEAEEQVKDVHEDVAKRLKEQDDVMEDQTADLENTIRELLHKEPAV